MVNAFFQTPLTEDIAVLPPFFFKLISLSLVFKTLDYVRFFFRKLPDKMLSLTLSEALTIKITCVRASLLQWFFLSTVLIKIDASRLCKNWRHLSLILHLHVNSEIVFFGVRFLYIFKLIFVSKRASGFKIVKGIFEL